jgi:PDZ domain/C2 domain
MSRLPVASLLLLALALAGCPAVYPELGTHTRAVAAGRVLDPAPPPELRWIKFLKARLPDHARDGRPWQANGKVSAYAKLLVNGAELIRTPVEPDSLTPTWPKAPHGNYKIAPGDRLRVELWQTDSVNDKPLGGRDLGAMGDLQVLDGRVHVEMEEGISSSSVVEIAIEQAHAVSGLGLWYELRSTGCTITRLLEQSPAERVGLAPGDELLKIGGRDANTMTVEELKSAFNAIPMDGLKVQVKHAGGSVSELVLMEGPIYATFAQFGVID